jgi:replicative DNA helicase
LDWLLGGMKAGQLIIIAARPAVGKTSLGMNMAEHIAVDCGVSVGVFSLEMEAEELGFRMACSRSGVDNKLAQSGGIPERDFPKIHKVVAAIANSPLTIDARGGLTIAQVAARARRMVHRHGIKLLVVDYLSLIAGGGRHENRTAEITRVSNGLKTLAKQLKLPIIALSQLNRDSDKGTPRKPRLSDLRDSGSVEQDADICILLHRDESKEGWEDEPMHRIQLIIAKHRNGPTGLIDMDFHCSTTRFHEASTVDNSAR